MAGRVISWDCSISATARHPMIGQSARRRCGPGKCRCRLRVVIRHHKNTLGVHFVHHGAGNRRNIADFGRPERIDPPTPPGARPPTYPVQPAARNGTPIVLRWQDPPWKRVPSAPEESTSHTPGPETLAALDDVGALSVDPEGNGGSRGDEQPENTKGRQNSKGRQASGRGAESDQPVSDFNLDDVNDLLAQATEDEAREADF